MGIGWLLTSLPGYKLNLTYVGPQGGLFLRPGRQDNCILRLGRIEDRP